MADIKAVHSFSQTQVKAEKIQIHQWSSSSENATGETAGKPGSGSVTQSQSETRVSALKQQLNESILNRQMEASVKAGNEPLALLYKTAIEGINDVLQASMGEDYSIQKAYDSGVDVSPEATAERILSFSTGFYGQYREQHPELSEPEAAQSFVDLIGGGVDRGFAEARDILDSLKVLQGDIATNIDKTYDLVQEGLKNFLDSFQTAESESQSGEIDSNSSKD